jgi:CDP-glycerol glycerophosphotransferase
VEKTVLLPLPRIDYILNTPKKNDEIKAVYPNIFKKPILLYAPTFRGEKVNLSNLQNIVDLEKYNVVVKLHPADKQGLDSSVNKEILCDREFSSFDWMKSCEVLITDYSGMGFEAMLLNKKVYYYLYDYDDYTEKNGLALDLFSEAIAPYVARSADELCEVLKKDYDFSLEKRYVEKYLSVGTENCSKRLAEFVIGLLKE